MQKLLEKMGLRMNEDKLSAVLPEHEQNAQEITGKIIKVSSKGFGFISTQDVPFTRIFFHWTALRNDTLKFTDIRAGMKVTALAFEVEGKGWRAIKIKILEEESQSVE